jgi:hypothetical protein
VVSKNKPVEPLSTKLPVIAAPPATLVEKLRKVGSNWTTVALPSALLDCVPMPKTKEPVMLVCGLVTAGSSMITPLLSVAKRLTGFCTCWLRATPVTWQPAAGHW